MIRICLSIVSILLGWQLSFAQNFDLSAEIPSDTSIRTGILENGLTYYILHNEKPKERASFYIYQNVGAVLESDSQNGLAHFLEHMAFNGTKHFPGKEMLNSIERHGVAFGKDVNAYTSLNETVYNLSNVPVKSSGLTDTCLLVLRDWSDDLLLTTEEIDAERGVITEEWRTKQGYTKQLRDQIRRETYAGSIYAKRDVIGPLSVIQHFHPDTLRKFYHDWYRTDLQGIAVIGDVDVDEMEQKIIALFSDIEAVENPKPRTYPEIPDNEVPRYILATSKALTTSNISISYRRKHVTENNLQSIRDSYVQSMFNSMIKERIRETLLDEADYLKASIGFSGFEKNYMQLKVSATARRAEEDKALSAVYTLLEQVRQFGFTAEELERDKHKRLVSIENAQKNKDPKSNEAHAQNIKNAFLNNRSIASKEFGYHFTKEIIPTITLEEVSNLAEEWMTDHNQIWTITGPSEDSIHLSKDGVQTVLNEVKNSELSAYVPMEVKQETLLSELPVGGKVISEKEIPLFGATEWTLSNGAKVVYRHADHEKESVVIKGTSWGGSSQYNSKDLPNAANATSFIKNYGIGDLNTLEYRRIMTGNTAGSSVSIGNYSEIVSASATPEDFETAMQLVYMRFEKPRFDKDGYNRVLKRHQEAINNQVETPESFMTDTVTKIYTQNHDRIRLIDQTYLDDLDYDRMNDIYRERFSDADDFTFFIVGNVDKDTAKKYAEKYLGAIPSKEGSETWVDNGVRFPKGKNEYVITVPNAPARGRVMLRMEKGYDLTRENIIYQNILASVLTLRFTENIREKEGGTYGVSVRALVERRPEEKLGLKIQFDCDKSKVDYLKGLVYDELKVITKKVSEDDLNKVILNFKKNAEQGKDRNGYWLSALETYYETGEDITSEAYFNDIVNNVSVKDIRKYAKSFFKKVNTVDVVFLSENED